ncbi:hypothetical protein FF100_33370 [Methylobacterium terricola]|uniref:Tn3 transposase DDE domain-containing protein n=1 Tax=Methylobacterium terricola TaxID=2583531 RepID=A0A5C4L8Z1_9HYPH|nr:hypothetical protein [Methylobacterium terricola]TNC07132.1 hypothetical protein FF100_33370 [Methylobacterium terricola]
MPTDYPQRRRPRARGMAAIRIALVSVRLRIIQWRIEQAIEGRDHVRLWGLISAYHDLHARTVKEFAAVALSDKFFNQDAVYGRARQIIPMIAREERRLERIAGRLHRARSAGDGRSHEKLYSLAKFSYGRISVFWSRI